jgi:hypothetical protein
MSAKTDVVDWDSVLSPSLILERVLISERYVVCMNGQQQPGWARRDEPTTE